MKEITTVGQICVDDEYGFTYYLSKIEYCLREDESYSYTFTPNYSVIDLLTSKLFQGIPGLDLSLRKEKFLRENMTPVFISERTPGQNREDLWELLERYDMEYLNRLEWLIRTELRYSGDPMYVERFEEVPSLNVDSLSDLGSRSGKIMQTVLNVICKGGTIRTSGCRIDDTNRGAFYSVLMQIFLQEKKYLSMQKRKGIQKAAEEGKYRGRTKKEMDEMKFLQMLSEYRKHLITGEQAAAELNISRSTFMRRCRMYMEKM